MKGIKQDIVPIVGKLSNNIRRLVEGVCLKGSGAQEKVLHMLLAANGKEDIFQKDIEAKFGIRPSSATALLKKMENNGMITRQPAEHDGRLKKIVVTPEAMVYQEKVWKDLEYIDNKLTRGIPEEDLETFYRVAKQMIENLSQSDEK